MPAIQAVTLFQRSGLRGFRLFGYAGLGTVKLEKQRRRFAIAQLRIMIDAVHHDVVDEFDPRDRNGRLDHGDGRVHRIAQPVEAADRG